MLPASFVEEMKEQLLLAKQRLEGDLAGLKPHEELGTDVDSSAQEVADDEVSQDVMARMKSDLEKIDKALAKIANGSYGTDDNGEEIGQERLKAMPWADKAI